MPGPYGTDLKAPADDDYIPDPPPVALVYRQPADVDWHDWHTTVDEIEEECPQPDGVYAGIEIQDSAGLDLLELTEPAEGEYTYHHPVWGLGRPIDLGRGRIDYGRNRNDGRWRIVR